MNRTRVVISELHKEDRMHHEPWESMSLDTAEAFRVNARAWLCDRSELDTATIDGADWSVVHAHFVAEKQGF